MAGLYIHVPFCASKCAYCDFYSGVSPARITDYPEVLKREMIFRCGFLPGGRLDTIYVGGGTPSLLSPERLQGLLDHAVGLWDCSGVREATVEANPEDLTDDYLARLGRTGFDRLSIGIQSFDDSLLRLMNRRHDASRAKSAVQAAQKAGFDNITIDLIYGIPGMTGAQWKHILDEAVALGVQHISAYHLTIEPGTAFGRQRLRPIPETESERQYETLRRRLGEAGFEHYEISNFAMPGRRAIHNSAYWSGEAYLGVGPSAHSFDGGHRREWIVADIEKYMAGVGADTIYESETLSDTELFNERIMTGLRTAGGIKSEKLRMKSDAVQKFMRDGLLVKNGDRVAVPPEKFLLSDFIISELMEV